VARAQATLAIGDRVCSLTTVQCGATPSRLPSRYRRPIVVALLVVVLMLLAVPVLVRFF
jgi:hypothetical protein